MSVHFSDTNGSPPLRPEVRRKKTKDAVVAPDSKRAQQFRDGGAHRSFDVVYIGVAVAQTQESPRKYTVGMTVHDGTYAIDYESRHYPESTEDDVSECEALSPSSSPTDVPSKPSPMTLTKFVFNMIKEYRAKHQYKIAGGGITSITAELCPTLPSELWKKLDIVCLVFKPFTDEGEYEAADGAEWTVDEDSDCVVRKTLEKFGPGNLPRPVIMHGNKVGVDVNGRVQISTLEDYKGTVHPNTWKATEHFANDLKKNKIKIAFFNTTTQGGGVALMRHALLRFFKLIGVSCEWYVPRPNSTVFRLTKNNHNILQGVDPDARLLPEHITQLDDWIDANAQRSWLRNGGPLAPRSKGGADIIIVDDPQMPKLVRIAKEQDPSRPVIYRSHIQVRADLTDTPGTAAADVWAWIWSHINVCDVFISHPVSHFIPKNVPREKVGYMPATTDWLDGLNKLLDEYDGPHYLHEFSVSITHQLPNAGFKFEFADTARPYIVQIARFDPAKGIKDVLASYAYLRRELLKDEHDDMKIPQLVIAGHGAIDDPDAQPVYNETMHIIETKYKDLEKDIIVMRVGPTDQILNALMQNAHVALQLSTREGFEVKVSEALHAGTPVIATKRGGIPLQVVHGKSGYLVECDDKEHEEVAKHLYHLFTDEAAYRDMEDYAATHVSDEVSTVGNALCWMYLADRLSKGEKVLESSAKGEICWISDVARKTAGIEWASGESKLHRTNLPSP